ncbi:hypothetical protein L0337_22580 [candidate division KSB1 bacterium]|nr:hypothetical protein [candidate division KSB1 bacterium]
MNLNAKQETMQRSNQWLGYARRVVMLIMAGLQLSACQQKPDTPAQIDPTKVEYTGEALHRVRLTAKRAEELGIKTAQVREEKISGKLRKVIPTTAVVYDQHGNTWTFKNPDSLVFVRERISVDHIDGDLAVLSNGPSVGAAVVTAGAHKLFSDEVSENREGIVESKTREGDKGKKSTGIATMKEDGTIRLVYKTEGAAGLGASVVIEYKPQDEDYQKILDQVGGLKVGESKAVPPWPEK